MLSLEEERKKCGSLERRLNETEGKWEGVVNRYKNNEQDLKTKLNQLSRELEASKDDMARSHREIMKLKAEQDRVMDNSKNLKSEFTTTKENLRSTEEVVAVLRGELSRKSKELMNTFDFSREGQAKMEFEVVHLQRNIEEERKSFVKDNCDLKLMLKAEQKKNEELTRVLKKNRDRLAENSAAINALGRAQQRAQAAERKIPELQEELDSTLLRLETVQTQASDLAASRKELHVLKEDQIKLKLQLQEDKIHSSLIAQQLEETQEHLKSAEEREKHLAQINSDLKHQLLTTQSELTTIGDKHKNVEDLHFVSEQGKQTLQDRAIEQQTEVTRLQMELNQISNQLDNQNRKYLNLKLQTKEKMENARNIFNRQKTLLVEIIQQAQNELNSVKGELEREQNDKEETKKKNQALLNENRQNSLISGTDISRPGLGLLMKSVSLSAPRTNVYGNGLNTDSPRPGVESDGMSADTEGR
ncbi:putative coiled-coil domain-containing protein [Apostichopus japonicus]|uniref:Putative coiled-coil domain-containing protein n=1 Tax=Stichopus japonicus TaxID=307972 RepID=A0A2G8K2H9_STIJA|nr:putative coiled-coil domain-containing protein [Apostichopus japonicus]